MNENMLELLMNEREKSIRASYYVKKGLIEKEWTKFTSGVGNVDTKIVSSEILDSWKRCNARGLDADGNQRPLILKGGELKQLRCDNEIFINAAKKFLANDYVLSERSTLAIGFFDHRGYLVETVVDPDLIGENKKDFWVAGSLWNEETMGTSAIAMVVKTQKPARVFGPEHYKKPLHGGTAYAAPIFNSHKIFIGGIVLTGRYYHSSPYTLSLAVAAAEMIENRLKINEVLEEYDHISHENEIAYSYQKTFLSSLPIAMIGTNNNGYITIINNRAREVLSIDAEDVEGKHLKEFLGHDSRKIFRLLENNQDRVNVEIRIFSNHVGVDYSASIHPILNSKDVIIGNLIILTEIKKVRKFVTEMIGARAKFHFADIVGRDNLFLKTIEQAQRASTSNSNVLLLGESGTGKDIFAQAIHNASERAAGPYVAINCAAIPRDLIASELFGYADGAFTGSRRGGNPGKFELADGGTIFLDEIGETSLELQVSLLRVIEEKSVSRIGGKGVRPVDVRIIAATNKNLQEEIWKGYFRRDLYYRINVFTIHMLPLSERKNDIRCLVEHFVKKYSNIMGKKIKKIDEDVFRFLIGYPWPGNVRELQNVVERMMHDLQDEKLTIDLIPPEIANFNPKQNKFTLSESPHEFERQFILKLLNQNMSKSDIAKKLNITRSTLYRKLNKHNIPWS